MEKERRKKKGSDRKSYNLQFKIDAVDYFRLVGNVTSAARHFKVSRTQIRNWSNEYERLVGQNVGASRYKLKLHAGSQPFRELDERVWNWYAEERKTNPRIPVREIQAKAMGIAQSLGRVGFKASRDWAVRWRRDHGVPFRVCSSTKKNQCAGHVLVSLIQ